MRATAVLVGAAWIAAAVGAVGGSPPDALGIAALVGLTAAGGRLPAALTALVALAVLAPLAGDPTLPAGPPDLPPGWAHPLGTDALGRDGLARWLAGARVSIGLALVTAALSAVLGAGVGLLAGLRGGWTDRLLVLLVDTWTAVPPIVLQLCVLGLVRPSDAAALAWLVVVLAGTGWMRTARAVRAQAMSLAHRPVMDAGRVLGLPERTLVVDHVLPEVWPTVLSLGALEVIGALHAEAALSWLGLGVRPPWPSWGTLLRDATDDGGVRLTWLWPCAALLWATLALRAVARS